MASSSATSSGQTSRRLVLICLATALALASVIAWEAFASARARRAAVESVLEGYARLAADQFAQNVALAIDYGWGFPVLRQLTSEGAEPIDPGTEVRTQYDTVEMGRLAVAVFELRRDPEPGEASPWPPGALSGRIEEEIWSFADRLVDEDWRFATLVDESSSEPRIFFFGPESAPPGEARTERRLRGFEGAPTRLEDLLRLVIARYPLLPESLTQGQDAAGLVSVAVKDGNGRELFRQGPSASYFVATRPVGPHVAGLFVEAGIPSGAAPSLVIGGLPPYRAPLIAILLMVAVGLVIAAILLLRRERELARLRESFVAGASHELRTPLAQIRMFAETLRLERVRSEVERRRYLEVIDREAHRLSLLVDNLLEFSRPSSQSGGISPRTLELSSLIAEVVEGFEPVAREREADVEIDAAAPLQVRADRDLVRQMLLNLLDNATKYGPAGQTVTVGARPVPGCGEAQDLVELSVSDQGPGIAPEDRERVWERFWRAPAARGTTGTGIGLAVVDELIRLHGGSASVDASVEGGARFTLRFPVAGSRP